MISFNYKKKLALPTVTCHGQWKQGQYNIYSQIGVHPTSCENKGESIPQMSMSIPTMWTHATLSSSPINSPWDGGMVRKLSFSLYHIQLVLNIMFCAMPMCYLEVRTTKIIFIVRFRVCSLSTELTADTFQVRTITHPNANDCCNSGPGRRRGSGTFY